MKYICKILFLFNLALCSSHLSLATSYTFTNAGTEGSEGPTQTQIDSNYSGTNLANSISINTRGIQEWTVPADGNYSIEVWGAQGGRGGVNDSIVEGGRGAKVKGVFDLSKDEVLKIMIGQKGLGGGDGVGGGGGGGSFVVVGSTPLIVAGGGGGGSYNSTHGPGVDSRVGGDGRADLSISTAAGTTSNASGGAGFLSNSTAGSSSGIAKSFTNGGSGATGKTNHDGGFGGGGGGSSSFPSGGGGGGYQGGNASGLSWTQSIGQSKGGYSYNSGTDQNNTTGINTGHGKVAITPLQTNKYTFTNAGANGSNGPTQSQIDANYSGTNLENTVNIITNGIQKWTVPFSGSYFFELWGASGGEDAKTNTSNVGGKGGYASGKLNLNSGDIIYILVGQQGVDTSTGIPALGGFNGGGNNQRYGGSGGGASDIRINGTELANRIIVAGGGGGAYAGSSAGNGGNGGGLNGENGTSGTGGTQSSGGNGGGILGVGGFSNPANSGGAGGGGYYGGGAANSSWGSGGGGSSYIGGVLEGNTTSGVNVGNGLVVITVLSSSYNLIQSPVITQGNDPITKAINEDTSVTWTASELNATDADTNASSLTWSLVTAPSHGTAIIDGNGSSPAILSFQPNANFNGSDSFSVQVSDGENNDSITINLTINSVNDNPIIHSINGQSLSNSLTAEIQVTENSSISLDINASDSIEGDTITFEKTGGTDRSMFDLNSSTGILSLSSAPDFENPTDADANNTYEIWFRANDGNGGFAEKRITIRVTNVLEDNDGDGTEDAYDPDDDNDGFSDAVEISYGSDPMDSNSTANAAPTDLNTTSALQVSENQSVGTVVGQLTATDPDTNATLTFTLVSGENDNHLFSIDSNGTLKTAAVFNYESNSSHTIQAKVRDQYNLWIKENFTVQITNIIEDLDGDGTEDHFDTDDDNDGFSDAVEIAYGSDPMDANSTANAAPTDLNTTSTLQVSENQSVGTVVGQLTATDPDANATLTFKLVSGENDNHLFSIDSNGTLKTAAVFNYESNSSHTIQAKVRDQYNLWIKENFTVQITNIIEDLDGDGTEDHFDTDDDNDGFSDAVEIAYGSDPMDANSTANAAPTDLNTTSALQVSENQSVGTVVGQLTATDPDANATLTFTLISGENDNHLFSIDSNGTLKTAAVFNYESNSSHTIQAKVRDQYNLWIKENFTVQITNIIEDLDGDGTEDHFDPDDDNDGFSDAVEIAYGSDPMDANSTANAAPTDLNTTSALQVSENQSVGTVVGQLTATDPDANATLTFTLVGGSNDNDLFTIETNGTLRSASVFDFESNSSYTIRVKVRDQYNLSIKENFSVQITNIIEDLDGDGTEDHFDTDDDNDGFSDAVELVAGTDPRNPASLPNRPPSTLDLNGSSILESLPVGSLVGKLSATDPDANSTFTFSLVDGNGSDHNQNFSIDTNGTLRTTTVLDYESNVTAYHVRVRVTDEFNAALEGSFTISLLDALPPFVRTLETAGSNGQKITLLGETGTSSRLPLLSYGFQVGQSLLLSNSTIWNGTALTDSNFSTEIPLAGLQPETKYFFRAFASNTEGTTYGTVQPFITPSLSNTAGPWWKSVPEIAGGWRTSPWLGTFLAYPQDWIYHADLGWLYTHSGSNSDLWLWSDEEGWLWTGPGIYPYLFQNSSANWLYFIKKKDGKPRFYDYTTKSIK